MHGVVLEEACGALEGFDRGGEAARAPPDVRAIVSPASSGGGGRRGGFGCQRALDASASEEEMSPEPWRCILRQEGKRRLICPEGVGERGGIPPIGGRTMEEEISEPPGQGGSETWEPLRRIEGLDPPEMLDRRFEMLAPPRLLETERFDLSELIVASGEITRMRLGRKMSECDPEILLGPFQCTRLGEEEGKRRGLVEAQERVPKGGLLLRCCGEKRPEGVERASCPLRGTRLPCCHGEGHGKMEGRIPPGRFLQSLDRPFQEGGAFQGILRGVEEKSQVVTGLSPMGIEGDRPLPGIFRPLPVSGGQSGAPFVERSGVGGEDLSHLTKGGKGAVERSAEEGEVPLLETVECRRSRSGIPPILAIELTLQAREGEGRERPRRDLSFLRGSEIGGGGASKRFFPFPGEKDPPPSFLRKEEEKHDEEDVVAHPEGRQEVSAVDAGLVSGSKTSKEPRNRSI